MTAPAAAGAPPRVGVVVVGHGSRRDEANDVLRQVATAVAARGAVHAVRAAFLELAAPDVPTAFAELVGEGCDTIVVHPYFLYPGNHSTSDIPALARTAAAAHPGVMWSVTEPLNLDDRIVDVVVDRVASALEVS